MSLVMEEFPNLKIQYVGIDIDSHACILAQKNLRELEIDSKVLCQDFQEGVEEEQFDVIVSVNCFYYLQFIEKALEICQKLISPKG